MREKRAPTSANQLRRSILKLGATVATWSVRVKWMLRKDIGRNDSSCADSSHESRRRSEGVRHPRLRPREAGPSPSAPVKVARPCGSLANRGMMTKGTQRAIQTGGSMFS